jgi:hypothetical protein
VLPAGFLLGILFDPEDGSSYVPPKPGWTSIGVHDVTSQNIAALFMFHLDLFFLISLALYYRQYVASTNK